MPADVIDLPPRADVVDERTKKERAFEAAVAALRGVGAAREAAVRALDELAEAFVNPGETYEATLARSFDETLRTYSAETIAIWQLVGFVQTEDLDRDLFDNLTRLDVPELEQAWAAWKQRNWPEERDDG